MAPPLSPFLQTETCKCGQRRFASHLFFFFPFVLDNVALYIYLHIYRRSTVFSLLNIRFFPPFSSGVGTNLFLVSFVTNVCYSFRLPRVFNRCLIFSPPLFSYGLYFCFWLLRLLKTAASSGCRRNRRCGMDGVFLLSTLRS